MKNVKINILIFAAILLTIGCEKDLETEGLSNITYYPEFTMSGASTILLEKGSTFTDPGVTAEEDGNEIEVGVSVIGLTSGYRGTEVKTDVVDEYVISYSATNSDGFAGTIERSVWVAPMKGDLVNDISGLYTSTIVRDGTSDAQYTDLEYITIENIGGDTYSISDGIGGYYAIGRAYGAAYVASGATVIANDIPNNDFTYGPSFGVGVWGGVATLSKMVVDPVAKTVSFTTVWSEGYTFVVTLTQVQI